MATRSSEPQVLLVAAFDDALHAHAALRRRALERLGCRVSTLNLMGTGGWLSRIRRVGLHDRLARAIASTTPVLVLVLEGAQVDAAMVASLRHGGGPAWVNWFCDARRSPEDIRPLAAAYDAVFVADGATLQALDQPGHPPVHYLPAGCDPSIHRPMRARDRFRANVVFAGTATPHRARQLAELVEFGVAVWGPGWRRTKLRDYCRGELLSHEDYIRAYAGASVAINVSCAERDDGPGELGASRRLFELAAIGVPQVVEDHPDIHVHFREGSEILVARQPQDLRTLTSEALHDRAWAEQVAAGARQRAIAEHTYMHRLAALLQVVGPAPAFAHS
ncbi:MAG TPA: glycosyltransferase [Gemmatimonadales bacterium]|nr:glycosyltransferase [Gemmatimonadales bacterium]